MMTTTTPTDTVMAIGQINFTGNVTPASWWKHITLPSGRPDQTAITLLSEIIYWYRPSEVRNEATGALQGYRKRFRGDKLQRSYQSFADQFGFGKRETADALKRLRDAGLITLELRTIEASGGLKCANVLFVGVVPCAIAGITNTISTDGVNDVTPVASERNRYSQNATPVTLKRNTPQRRNGIGGTPNVDTNTEITTENTTEITLKNKTLDAFADAHASPGVSGCGGSTGKTTNKQTPGRQDYSPEFETAWQLYPKRAGGNPKPSAFKAWKARLREGVTPETLMEGVKRYAAYVRATGSTGTQFVKQAATFFGPDRHFEESWLAPPAPGGGRNSTIARLSGLGHMSDEFGESSDNLTF